MESGERMAETGGETDHIPGVEVARGEEAIVEAPPWDRDLNIYQRIFTASHQIEKLEKDGHVKIGNGGYDYITHDLTTAAVKRAFRDVGVMVIPTVIKHDKDGNRTELTISASFINVDNPSDNITVTGIGYGVDSSDKGPGKAYSYAVKYIYMKLLMLNSADDIEEDNTKHEPEVSQEALAKEKVGVKAQMKSWADNLNAAIKGAQSLQELKDIQKNNRVALMAEDLPEVTREFFIDQIEARKVEITE